MPLHITISLIEMKIYFLSAIIYFVFSLPNRNSVAQEVAGLSFGYEYFPSTELVTPGGKVMHDNLKLLGPITYTSVAVH